MKTRKLFEKVKKWGYPNVSKSVLWDNGVVSLKLTKGGDPTVFEGYFVTITENRIMVMDAKDFSDIIDKSYKLSWTVKLIIKKVVRMLG